MKEKKIAHVDVENELCSIDDQRSLSVGKVVFKPKKNKEFVLFLTDSEGVTHPVTIRPDNSANANLFVVPIAKEIKEPSLAEKLSLKQLNHNLRTGEGRNIMIYDLIKSMAEKKLPRNVSVQQQPAKVSMWDQVSLTRDITYTTGSLVGSRYVLKNVSETPVSVAEKSLYSVDDNVAAVAIETPKLLPGEESYVYIVTITKHK